MDEGRVLAAVARIEHEAHGLFMGTGEECRMVPVSALDELAEAVHGARPARLGLSRLVEVNRKLDAALAPGESLGEAVAALIDAAIATPDDVSTDRPPAA